MTLIAARLGVVAEDAFSLGKISPIQGFYMQGLPALQRSVVFRNSRTSIYGYRQRPLPFQLRFLDLLATGDADC